MKKDVIKIALGICLGMMLFGFVGTCLNPLIWLAVLSTMTSTTSSPVAAPAPDALRHYSVEELRRKIAEHPQKD